MSKMILLILSVIVMCPNLYPVCLVSRVLKNTHFKEHLLVFASKFRNLHYVQYLNIAPNRKAMVYDPNEKGIMESWFIAPVERAWIYLFIYFTKL